MEMIDKMDAGRMYAFEECEISPDDNYTSLCKKIVDCGKRVLKNNLDLYFEGKLQGIEQDEKLVTFADKISSFDEKVDLSKTTKKLLNWIRGLSEEPGGYILLNDLKFKIFKAHKISDEITSEVGTLIINKRTILQLVDGQIELDEVQLEGKKKMDGRSFANGPHHLNNIIAK